MNDSVTRQFLARVVAKSLREAEEELKSKRLDSKDKSDDKTKDSSSNAPVEKPTEKPETDRQKSEPSTRTIPKASDVTLDMIVKKVNELRAGRSVKDERVKNELMAYFKELPDEDRLALWVYVTGLSEILRGMPGAQALDPKDAEDEIDIVSTKDHDTDSSVDSLVGRVVVPIRAKRRLGDGGLAPVKI